MEQKHYHVWYRLVRRRMALAAEVRASQSDRRAWVAVFPVGKPNYIVQYFEVEADYLRKVEENEWELPENRLLNVERFPVTGEVELEHTVGQWLDDLDKLVQPYFCNYPL